VTYFSPLIRQTTFADSLPGRRGCPCLRLPAQLTCFLLSLLSFPGRLFGDAGPPFPPLVLSRDDCFVSRLLLYEPLENSPSVSLCRLFSLRPVSCRFPFFCTLLVFCWALSGVGREVLSLLGLWRPSRSIRKRGANRGPPSLSPSHLCLRDLSKNLCSSRPRSRSSRLLVSDRPPAAAAQLFSPGSSFRSFPRPVLFSDQNNSRPFLPV